MLYNNADTITILYKNLSFFFIVIKGSKWLQERERERERERVRLTKVCYLWHCAGDRYSEPYFCFSAGGHRPPWMAPKTACIGYLLAVFRIWPNLCVSTANLFSLQSIFTALAFPSGSQFTRFISVAPLFILRIRCDIRFTNPQHAVKDLHVTRTQWLYLED